MMNSFNSVPLFSDPKRKPLLCSLLVAACLICGVYFVGTAWLDYDTIRLSSRWGLNVTEQQTDSDKCEGSWTMDIKANYTRENTSLVKCNDKCRPEGSKALPKGILSATSNLEMVPLWGPVVEEDVCEIPLNQKTLNHTRGLLAMAVGVKQKKLVNQTVTKFFAHDFRVMLFHYDGAVNEWNDLEWNEKVIHISARNQTKWWFAKRFLHPDIVAEYEYIFLWDEDLRVEYFDPGRYLSIVKEEGLEISQPALDGSKSEVHHRITLRSTRTRVHRRYYKFTGGGRCYGNSTAPPCVGWVEMMAPVFSRAAWRCAWYMIQNDLIHAWGLDFQLGYCAQGDRTLNVGVVDEQYIIHLGLPTLGGVAGKNKTITGLSDQSSQSNNSSDSESLEHPDSPAFDFRSAVRLRSYIEMKIFRERWKQAVKEDECWVDPYEEPE